MTRWQGARPPGLFQMMCAVRCSAAPQPCSITRHDALPAWAPQAQPPGRSSLEQPPITAALRPPRSAPGIRARPRPRAAPRRPPLPAAAPGRAGGRPSGCRPWPLRSRAGRRPARPARADVMSAAGLVAEHDAKCAAAASIRASVMRQAHNAKERMVQSFAASFVLPAVHSP